MSDAATVEQATASAGGDRLLATQLQLARIDGMLTAILQGNEVRFAAIEAGVAVHERRLNDKGKLLARHDERITDAEEQHAALAAMIAERQKATDNDRGPRVQRTIAAIALLLALPGFAIALSNLLAIRGGLTP